MSCNEADARAELIAPRFKMAGWIDSHASHKHYYYRHHVYTADRIYSRDDRAHCGQPHHVDYLLRYTDTLPSAVAKADADVLGRQEGPQFDLLAHIALGRPHQRCRGRAGAILNREGCFINDPAPAAYEAILALLDKCREGGVEEMTDSRIFRPSPLRKMSKAVGIIRRLGDAKCCNQRHARYKNGVHRRNCAIKYT